jgi:hypothetical protein
MALCLCVLLMGAVIAKNYTDFKIWVKLKDGKWVITYYRVLF